MIKSQFFGRIYYHVIYNSTAIIRIQNHKGMHISFAGLNIEEHCKICLAHNFRLYSLLRSDYHHWQCTMSTEMYALTWACPSWRHLWRHKQHDQRILAQHIDKTVPLPRPMEEMIQVYGRYEWLKTKVSKTKYHCPYAYPFHLLTLTECGIKRFQLQW